MLNDKLNELELSLGLPLRIMSLVHINRTLEILKYVVMLIYTCYIRYQESYF